MKPLILMSTHEIEQQLKTETNPQVREALLRQHFQNEKQLYARTREDWWPLKQQGFYSEVVL